MRLYNYNLEISDLDLTSTIPAVDHGREAEFNVKKDSWTLGVILYELLFGMKTF